MGDVVELRHYQRPGSANEAEQAKDSLVPIEFAIGKGDRSRCLEKLAAYGIQSIHIRRITEEPEALLYLMTVQDAITINKMILEKEPLGDEEIARRIDVIQMLENINPVLLDSLWESFTQQGNYFGS